MNPITVKNLKSTLNNKDVILIDVREKVEHDSEKISEALHIPLGELDVKLISPKYKHIIFHCQSGRRSLEACKKILAQDPKRTVYSLEGGIVAWKEAGHTIAQGHRNILPIDRQTQIVAGILILVGFILGNLVDSLYYYLSAFVGLGLTFAGITGWCGMAKFLAKMPWNK